MLVVGEFKVSFPEDMAQASSSPLSVTVTNPIQKPHFKSRQEKAGKFTFTTDTAGPHEICFTNSAKVSARFCVRVVIAFI
jgi:hypothetical protein